MVLYPDNVSRYQRLQQLLDHISHKQLDIMNDVKDLTSSKKHLDGVLTKLKSEGKVAPFDELLNEATASMSEEQQKRLRTLVKPQSQSSDGLVNIAPQLIWIGLAATGTGVFGELAILLALTVDRYAALAAGIQNIDPGMHAELVEEAYLYALNGAQAAVPVNPNQAFIQPAIGRAERILRGLRIFARFLTFIGTAATLFGIVVQAIEGPKQRAAIIEAIQKAQVARLALLYTHRAAQPNILLVNSAKLYADSLAEAEPPVSNYIKKKFAEYMTKEQPVIELEALQAELDALDIIDGTSPYTSNDLSSSEVIAQFQKALESTTP